MCAQFHFHADRRSELVMTRHAKFVVCLIAALCAEGAFSQAVSTKTEGNVSSAASLPVAYVYVSSSSSATTSEIHAYSAASDGNLTPVAGSPFSMKAAFGPSMAVTGKYLFANDGIDVTSFSIESDGALHRVSSINAQRYSGDCSGPGYLFLDHTGATLYDLDYDGNVCANNTYQFFHVDGYTGSLSYIGATTAASPELDVPLSFIGNNKYAYGSSCYHWNQEIFGFARNSDGVLTELHGNSAMPASKPGTAYCPYLAAADPTNHLAVTVQPLNAESAAPAGSVRLATYTVNGAGNLTTTSTDANMPAISVTNASDDYPTDLSMSPSGKLLAVAGAGGLQVFHFNGAGPITQYTGLLTKDEVDMDQMFWDNDDHLYAISQSAGKLFVFTITPTSYSQPSGSPYTIASPWNIIVLAK